MSHRGDSLPAAAAAFPHRGQRKRDWLHSQIKRPRFPEVPGLVLGHLGQQSPPVLLI